MEAQSIKEYESLEKYYWWFVGRRQIIERVLDWYFSEKNLSILDWGCGPGGNFKILEKFGRVLGVDASDEALRACQEKGITSVVKATDLDSFVAAEQYDLITNFDVLEHITEDEKFLRGVHALVKPEGYVAVTVPAFQFLWGPLDDAVGHKRRYTRKEISEKFRRCGYEVVRASYFIFFLSPVFIAYRMFEKILKKKSDSLQGSVVELPSSINWLLTRILFLEASIIPRLSLPFGTSIIVLAKKVTTS
jgi:SAM-dependent methyltransferase